MEIPFARWYPVIPQRRSRRKYDKSLPIPADIISGLKKVCADFKPFPSGRAELVIEPPDEVFKGAVGSYGKVMGAPAYLAFIGNRLSPYSHEIVGYTGEGVILEATAQGLATCWVAGLFQPEIVARHININPDERVLAVSPLGYVKSKTTLEERFMAGFGRHYHRRPLSSLVSGLPCDKWPGWIEPALEAARLAPSAINRQPWRFHVETASITVSVGGNAPDFNISRRLDCGIAMLHLEIAALSRGIKGKWELLDSPLVAQFNY